MSFRVYQNTHRGYRPRNKKESVDIIRGMYPDFKPGKRSVGQLRAIVASMHERSLRKDYEGMS